MPLKKSRKFEFIQYQSGLNLTFQFKRNNFEQS